MHGLNKIFTSSHIKGLSQRSPQWFFGGGGAEARKKWWGIQTSKRNWCQSLRKYASRTGTYCTLVEKNMDQILEQHCALKYSVKLSKYGSEILIMFRNAYSGGAMKMRQALMWHKRFWEVQKSVSDEYRSGRPLTSQTEVAGISWMLRNRSRIFGQSDRRGRNVDFEYDPESKRQSNEWLTNESPRPKKARIK